MKTSLKSLLAVGILLTTACATWINNEPFDATKWKNGDRRSRGKMAYSLQDGKTLVGKTRVEVIELLGKPDYSTDESLRYYIDTYIPIDAEFDARLGNDEVVSTDIGD